MQVLCVSQHRANTDLSSQVLTQANITLMKTYPRHDDRICMYAIKEKVFHCQDRVYHVLLHNRLWEPWHSDIGNLRISLSRVMTWAIIVTLVSNRIKSVSRTNWLACHEHVDMGFLPLASHFDTSTNKFVRSIKCCWYCYAFRNSLIIFLFSTSCLASQSLDVYSWCDLPFSFIANINFLIIVHICCSRVNRVFVWEIRRVELEVSNKFILRAKCLCTRDANSILHVTGKTGRNFLKQKRISEKDIRKDETFGHEGDPKKVFSFSSFPVSKSLFAERKPLTSSERLDKENWWRSPDCRVCFLRRKDKD